MEVVGYTYDAAMHCPKCTFDMAREVPFSEYQFGEYDSSDISTFPGSGITDMEKAIELEIIRDSEGNPIHAVFDTDEAGDSPDHCDDCHAFIDNSWTGETVEYVRVALVQYVEEWLQGRSGGNNEVLDVWSDELTFCNTESADDRARMVYEFVRADEKLVND